MPKVIKLYLCNKERCQSKCAYPTCKHTSQKYFAKYKIDEKERKWLVHKYSDGEKLYVEKEKNNGRTKGHN